VLFSSMQLHIPVRVRIRVTTKLQELERGRCEYEDGVVTILLRPQAPADVIAHECYHAVQFVQRHIGYTSAADVDEFGGYLIGQLVRDCTRRLAGARGAVSEEGIQSNS
jgi:hypothetical protein